MNKAMATMAQVQLVEVRQEIWIIMTSVRATNPNIYKKLENIYVQLTEIINQE